MPDANEEILKVPNRFMVQECGGQYEVVYYENNERKTEDLKTWEELIYFLSDRLSCTCRFCFKTEPTMNGKTPDGWEKQVFEKGHAYACPEHTGEKFCRVCGCTDSQPCKGGCWWVEEDLCSSCQTIEQMDKAADESLTASEKKWEQEAEEKMAKEGPDD